MKRRRQAQGAAALQNDIERCPVCQVIGHVSCKGKMMYADFKPNPAEASRPVLPPRPISARDLAIIRRTLEKWAFAGDGSPFIAVGGRRLYDLNDLEAWLEACKPTSTSDCGPSYPGSPAPQHSGRRELIHASRSAPVPPSG